MHENIQLKKKTHFSSISIYEYINHTSNMEIPISSNVAPLPVVAHCAPPFWMPLSV